MANGKITLGKQSGGTLGLVFPDGVSNTEVVLPESGELVNKNYVEDFAMNRYSKSLSTENLNDLTNGFYTQNLNINAKLEKNYPAAIAGNLCMYGAGDKFVQYYVPYNSGIIYLRVKEYESGWHPWQKLVTEAEFTGTNQSLTQNGYQKLPSGLIIQWGTYAIGDAFSANPPNGTVVMPITFPNANLKVLLSCSDSANGAWNVFLRSKSNASFNFFAMEWAGVTQQGSVDWLAIGY